MNLKGSLWELSLMEQFVNERQLWIGVTLAVRSMS